jgi:hypothetical protein
MKVQPQHPNEREMWLRLEHDSAPFLFFGQVLSHTACDNGSFSFLGPAAAVCHMALFMSCITTATICKVEGGSRLLSLS